jgi:hypothetical protein
LLGDFVKQADRAQHAVTRERPPSLDDGSRAISHRATSH